MAVFPWKLQKKLDKRKQENALRSLELEVGLVDFSSNDYLGFSNNRLLAEHRGKRFQPPLATGATGSRLLSGNHKYYQELETALATFFGHESALVFNSGYDANLGFFAAVPQRNDWVFFDEFIHASIRDGLQLSHAKSIKFRHNDLKDLKGVIERSRNDAFDSSEVYVVTESVFSMDGDSPDLRALCDFCKTNGYHLVVDEAHALGVFNKGLVHDLQIQPHVFAQIVTFGKAMGCHGAAILGGEHLKTYLINYARSLMYTTALPPHSLATVLAAVTFFETEAGQREVLRLRQNIGYFRLRTVQLALSKQFLPSESAIQIAVVVGNEKVKSLSHHLKANGFDVKPILSPTVKKGNERLRICLHAFNTESEIDALLQLIKKHG